MSSRCDRDTISQLSAPALEAMAGIDWEPEAVLHYLRQRNKKWQSFRAADELMLEQPVVTFMLLNGAHYVGSLRYISKIDNAEGAKRYGYIVSAYGRGTLNPLEVSGERYELLSLEAAATLLERHLNEET